MVGWVPAPEARMPISTEPATLASPAPSVTMRGPAPSLGLVVETELPHAHPPVRVPAARLCPPGGGRGAAPTASSRPGGGGAASRRCRSLRGGPAAVELSAL